MKEMRKHNIICLSICLVGLLASLAIVYFRYTVPYWQCSEVYKRYHKVEGVEAAYVKNFPINDTLTVAVTLLQAADSAGWEYLLQAFNIPHELTEIEGIDVWTWKALRNQPEKRYEEMEADRQRGEDEPEIEIVAISTKTQKISVFHTKNAQERSTIFNKKIESNI